MDPHHNRPIKVFYSYAHRDEGLRKKLEIHLSNLKRQGLIAEWYDRNISVGLDWAHEIDSHLNAAHVILLLLSADFISSEYCYGLEAKRAMERHEAGEARVIPILLRPTDWKRTPFEKLQALPRNAKPVTKWQNRDEAFLDIVTGIRNTLEELSITLSDIPLPSNDVQILAENELPSLGLWHIPYQRNPFFTGREDTLRNLYEALRVDKAIALSQPQAISGLGGIGKTQTVLEYAYRYCNDYHVILWVNADTRETLVSDLMIIAELLNLPEKNEQDQTLIVHAIKRWLQAHSSWLMILDNVEHLGVVSELIPQFVRGHILITTQHKCDQAEFLFQQAVVIREKIFGPEHPILAYSLNRLAHLYHVQRKYDRAEPLFQRALMIYEQAVDPVSPDMVITLNLIAKLYKDQGRYDQAEPLYQRALMIAEQVWGPKHPNVVRNLKYLARFYQAQGKYIQAQSFYQQALEIYEQTRGSEARDVANVLYSLAALLREMKKEGEASKLEALAQAMLAKSPDQKKPSFKRTSN